MTFAVVLVGGAVPERHLLSGLEHAEFVIAADGGVRIARTHGLPINSVVGDLDSATEGDLAWAGAEGAEIVEFPEDKDRTDLELALDRAEATGVDKIVAIGVDGGRLDHELGNWAALSAMRSALIEVHAAHGTATILHGAGHRRTELRGSNGDVVSLLPYAGDAGGVTTEGLRWPLLRATLSATGTRGISNELVGPSASVEIEFGILLVVRPRVPALDD